ncbi:MAG: LPXTG cell wall anchor domain-containing protein, partial [Staphylococcus rostri]
DSDSDSDSDSDNDSDADADHDKDSHGDALPETGADNANGTLFGTLFAAVGSLFLVGSRRRKNK